LETTLEHPQHIVEEVFDDEIMINVEEDINEDEEMIHLMTNNITRKMKQPGRKNERMVEMKQVMRKV